MNYNIFLQLLVTATSITSNSCRCDNSIILLCTNEGSPLRGLKLFHINYWNDIKKKGLYYTIINIIFDNFLV